MALGDQLFETLEIELPGLHAEQVTGGPRCESRLVAPDDGEHLAQAGDVIAQCVVGRVPTLLREELGDQAIA
jgi:hypothetical protein